MIYSVEPRLLSGAVDAPPSKSYAHRAIICAALSDGVSRIIGVSMSDDISATVGAMRALGASIDIDGDMLTVRGIHGMVDGDIVIDCAESGSTLRFIIPVALTR